MKLTHKVLKAMDARKEGEFYYVKMHGYEFRFKEEDQHWAFASYPYIKGWSHWVTDVEEIFGFIAKDFYDAGYEEYKRELREFLGIEKDGD